MANERERFEKLREDSLEQYTRRSTIMRFGDAEVRARADFRAGFHAGWQAHAESVGPAPRDEHKPIDPNEDAVVARTYVSVPKDMLCHKCGSKEPWKDDVNAITIPAESLSGDGATKEWRCFHCDEVFTDQKEAFRHFGHDDYCAQDDAGCVSPLRTDEKLRLAELRDAQEAAEQFRRERDAQEERLDFLEGQYAEIPRQFGDDVTTVWLAGDRYKNAIFERDQLRAAQPASIEKAQDEHELFAINYAEWAHGVKENHDRRPTFEEQNSYTDGWNDAIRAALQRNGGKL